ncbi:unnamed protein product [Clonostachys rosea]|uniref:Fungal-type protein kinase domain-containing protein n=1 Tax=Bionectria ochroleuca TaxID=29856 RepID=A0ABY6TZ09_BIOOC|nr:unnamed protein product [Clonostachys rosea]
MTMFIAFGSLRDDDDLSFHANSVMPTWLALFRGVRTVLEANNGAIYSSSVAFLFRSSEVDRLWESKQSDVGTLLEFQSFIDANTSDDDRTRQLLVEAFQDLRRSFYFFYNEDLGNEAKHFFVSFFTDWSITGGSKDGART